MEHIAGAFSVTGGDQRRMGIDKAPVVEKLVDGKSRFAAHPEGSVEQVGPGAQVGDGTQKFHRMALFLQRVIRRALPFHQDGLGLDLNGLVALGFHHLPLHPQGGAYADGLGLFVNRLVVAAHHLYVFDHGTVVELNESAGLYIPHCAHPAAQRHLLAHMVLRVAQQFSYGHIRHVLISFLSLE